MTDFIYMKVLEKDIKTRQINRISKRSTNKTFPLFCKEHKNNSSKYRGINTRVQCRYIYYVLFCTVQEIVRDLHVGTYSTPRQDDGRSAGTYTRAYYSGVSKEENRSYNNPQLGDTSWRYFILFFVFFINNIAACAGYQCGILLYIIF